MNIFTVYTMEWMLDIQLGRRNLSPIQRIAIAEKYRSLYEKQAKENQIKAGKEYGNGGIKVTPNLVEASDVNRSQNETNTKLAQVAGVGKETYRMGAKILNSDNEEIKKAVLSGEMSINAGYNKIRENKKIKDNNINTSIIVQLPTTTPSPQPKPQISDEVRQICEDLKTEPE